MSQTIRDSVEAAKALGAIVDQAKSVVFFGGAGVSTASGIPDFRSENGLYHQKFAYPAEEMLSHDFYLSHTAEFYDFYRTRMIALDAKPNRARTKLAELEAQGKLTAVITRCSTTASVWRASRARSRASASWPPRWRMTATASRSIPAPPPSSWCATSTPSSRLPS